MAVGDVERVGADKIIGIALDLAWQGAKAVYPSFDMDVMDSGCVPGTGCWEPGGLRPREALALVRGIAAGGISESRSWSARRRRPSRADVAGQTGQNAGSGPGTGGSGSGPGPGMGGVGVGGSGAGGAGGGAGVGGCGVGAGPGPGPGIGPGSTGGAGSGVIGGSVMTPTLPLPDEPATR